MRVSGDTVRAFGVKGRALAEWAVFMIDKNGILRYSENCRVVYRACGF